MRELGKNWALPQSDQQAVVQRLQQEMTGTKPSNNNFMTKLPTLLRILGAAALIVAMYSFLAKGWQSGNDLFRYLLMLGHTGLLAVIGLANGYWLKENKGARLLLTLALISVPANFAILGALIFSQSGAMASSAYPQYVAWMADSLNSALITSAATMVVLIPVTLLGFTVLARGMSKKLSLLFLFSNAALLLPIRDAGTIGIVVLLLTALTLYFSRQASYNQSAAKTREGITALGLQMLPLAILMGRSLWLYATDLFLFTVLATTMYVVLRQLALHLPADSRVRGGLNALSLLPAVSMILLIANALHEINLLPDAVLLPVGSLVSAAMIYDISLRSQNSARFYCRLAVGLLFFIMSANLFLFNGVLPALMCTSTGLALLICGYKRQQLSMFVGGGLMVLVGASEQLYTLAQHFDLGGWASLALIGIIAIVSASLMESKGGRLKPRLDAWKKK